jgi:hypothetical protein
MTAMIDSSFAKRFAADWIDSWNSHDLERVLAHYTDDFTMSSPLIIKIAGEPSGTLHGKDQVRAYWAKALQLVPDLHFELVNTLLGIGSMVLYYKSPRGLSAEVFLFNEQRKVVRSYANYAL